MDDNKTTPEMPSVVTIDGVDYPLSRPDKETAERIGVVMAMNAPTALKLEACGKMIEACLGTESFTKILRGYLQGAGDTKGLFDVLKTIGDALGAAPQDA